MARLSPSILDADFAGLGGVCALLEGGGADYIHLDVMDGHFVPNITFGPLVAKSLARHTGLPLDIHLMITSPDRYIPDFVTPRTGFVVVHQEAAVHLDRTLSLIRALGVRCGVALNPATPPESLAYVLDRVDQVLVMSVNPGFGGQAFIPAALEKVRRLAETRRSMGLDFMISVDGGVNLGNVREVIGAGADIVVAGSAVMGSKDPSKSLKEFVEACHAHP